MGRATPLRTIEARVAERGSVARKDAIARHFRNGHAPDPEAEVRALASALRRVLPSEPGVAAALAQEVEAEGADDLADALRSLIKRPA